MRCVDEPDLPFAGSFGIPYAARHLAEKNRRGCLMSCIRIILASLGLLWLGSSDAAAHSPRVPQDTSGISIPSLTHGQMAVIAAHRNDIHVLASWVAGKDGDVRRLMAFSRKQYVRCFWGLMPGSIADEASPMNECSHAYLAADRAMLIRMRALPFWRDRAVALFDTVENDMIRSGASLVLCVFSATPFNTASLVEPDWHDLVRHKPSLFAAGGVVGLPILVLGFAMTTLLRRRGGGAASRKSPVARHAD